MDARIQACYPKLPPMVGYASTATFRAGSPPRGGDVYAGLGKQVELLASAPADIRFHISRGAVESFVNTVPLLHPRGYLQVQDIFVATMDEYRQGFLACYSLTRVKRC